MPELPEVETVRRQLKKKITGKKIEKVEVRHDKTVNKDKNFESSLKGLSFIGIERIGKLLIFKLSDQETFLLGHLKMTGKFIYVDQKNYQTEESDKHVHVVFHFAEGSKLLFNDVRKFGYIKRVDENEAKEVRGKYGIEPLTANFTLEKFENIFENRKVSLKALLLDQGAIAGLGNIYVDEACFLSGVLPSRRSNLVTKSEKEKLYIASEKVIKKAIELGGTTFMNYADTQNKSGGYRGRLLVFGREGESCLQCGTTIEKTRVAGRGTHYCPSCQK